jgi:hypothetical protein
MKVTNKLFVGILAVAVAVTAAYAATLMTDDFTYPDGSLSGQGGWIDHSGTTGQMQVFGGEVYVKGTDSEDVNKSFAAQAIDATTYACFTLRVPPVITGGPVTGSNYFAHLKDTGTGFRSRVYVRPPASGGDFTIGLSSSSSSRSPLIDWPSDLSYDTSYRIVHNYDATTGIATLWIDPVDETSASIVGLNPQAEPAVAVSAYAWRQSTHDATAIVDKLSAGQAWDEVCNDPVQVDNTTWGSVKGIYR